MNSAEYQAALAKLALTPTEAADEFGVSRSASYRYAMGEQKIPKPVAKLVTLLCVIKDREHAKHSRRHVA